MAQINKQAQTEIHESRQKVSIKLWDLCVVGRCLGLTITGLSVRVRWVILFLLWPKICGDNFLEF